MIQTFNTSNVLPSPITKFAERNKMKNRYLLRLEQSKHKSKEIRIEIRITEYLTLFSTKEKSQRKGCSILCIVTETDVFTNKQFRLKSFHFRKISD